MRTRGRRGGARRPSAADRLVDAREVDLARLRHVAQHEGLADGRAAGGGASSSTHYTRRRAWPMMLGVNAYMSGAEGYAARTRPHKDSGTVQRDVERSLHSLVPPGCNEAEFARLRAALHRLVDGVVSGSTFAQVTEPDAGGGGDDHGMTGISYFQGFHDVASVLLLILGEQAAHPVLERLALFHLRACTRTTLDPVLGLLGLLLPLVAQLDADLAAKLAPTPVFWAVSWVLTWFAHSAESLDEAARLFDLFIPSSPLMPLYAAAAMAALARPRLEMQSEGYDPPLVHHCLATMRVGVGDGGPAHGIVSADVLAAATMRLFMDFPPHMLLRLKPTDRNAPPVPLEDLALWPYPWLADATMPGDAHLARLAERARRAGHAVSSPPPRPGPRRARPGAGAVWNLASHGGGLAAARNSLYEKVLVTAVAAICAWLALGVGSGRE